MLVMKAFLALVTPPHGGLRARTGSHGREHDEDPVKSIQRERHARISGAVDEDDCNIFVHMTMQVRKLLALARAVFPRPPVL